MLSKSNDPRQLPPARAANQTMCPICLYAIFTSIAKECCSRMNFVYQELLDILILVFKICLYRVCPCPVEAWLIKHEPQMLDEWCPAVCYKKTQHANSLHYKKIITVQPAPTKSGQDQVGAGLNFDIILPNRIFEYALTLF